MCRPQDVWLNLQPDVLAVFQYVKSWPLGRSLGPRDGSIYQQDVSVNACHLYHDMSPVAFQKVDASECHD